MGQNLFRVPVRFDLNNPEHSRIVSYLREVGKEKGSSMTGFIIKALSYYIKILSKNPLAGKGMKPAESIELITRLDMEDRFDRFEKEMRLYLFETFLPLVTGREPPRGTPPDEAEGNNENMPDVGDISSDPDIMKSISSWIE